MLISRVYIVEVVIPEKQNDLIFVGFFKSTNVLKVIRLLVVWNIERIKIVSDEYNLIEGLLHDYFLPDVATVNVAEC